MTDRELLELAAKAVGLIPENYTKVGGLAVYNPKTGTGGNSFNPLTDDGDALRLAVKLQLTVCNEHLSAGAAYCTGPEEDVFPEVISGRPGIDGEVIPDDYAATRRAIVRAAAEIGATK